MMPQHSHAAVAAPLTLSVDIDKNGTWLAWVKEIPGRSMAVWERGSAAMTPAPFSCAITEVECAARYIVFG